MRLTRKQLRNYLKEAITHINEQEKGPPYDIYRADEVARVFSDIDQDWWNNEGDSSNSVLRSVGPDALESLAEFLKKDPAWKAWYSKLGDDGTGGTV